MTVNTVEMAIRIAAVSKRYGRTLALDGVSFDVPRNKTFALLGPNGAGKTTLMHILCTILAPDSGIAEIAGFDEVRQPVQIGPAFRGGERRPGRKCCSRRFCSKRGSLRITARDIG